MLKINFIENSYLKAKPIKSTDLDDTDKYYIEAGDYIEGSRVKLGIHSKITLNPYGAVPTIGSQNTVYFYTPHTDFLREPKKLSDRGAVFIHQFEGCELTSYLCPAGVLTIGYGHTGKDVKAGQTITEKEAEGLFKIDVNRFEKVVNSLVKVSLTQNQFDALVSFVYNIGGGAFAKSTLLKKLNSWDYLGASLEFSRWTNKGLAGLVKRRSQEKKLFLK